jgi:hypothetical protein
MSEITIDYTETIAKRNEKKEKKSKKYDRLGKRGSKNYFRSSKGKNNKSKREPLRFSSDEISSFLMKPNNNKNYRDNCICNTDDGSSCILRNFINDGSLDLASAVLCVEYCRGLFRNKNYSERKKAIQEIFIEVKKGYSSDGKFIFDYKIPKGILDPNTNFVLYTDKKICREALCFAYGFSNYQFESICSIWKKNLTVAGNLSNTDRKIGLNERTEWTYNEARQKLDEALAFLGVTSGNIL